ncbi:lipopolysaccharide export system protein LptC [Pseudomonas duriflava]|uniref:Lipopolysaccharide export system protein LptC n=1 Tax=Pseudomonas duriflava TaxID=459528 RepID=A0A562QF71_9PSED|nr:LPS export ABC transporter periplasmic protein LptC [Pseudomonas duriflava]TWI55395.1 lipopolysaccharide export system protein LptC [Pseudomonas duriflava]
MFRTLRKPLSYGLIALVLAAIGYWNLLPQRFINPAETTSVSDSRIDAFAINARAIQYRPDGKVQYEMTSERLDHVEATDITHVTRPDVLAYRGTDLPWHMRSVRAEVAPGGSQAELIDDVRVERTDAKGRSTVLTTTRLTVFPDKDYAQTEQAVRIEAANGVTTALGMKAYLNDGRMLLLSKVRGQHEVR